MDSVEGGGMYFLLVFEKGGKDFFQKLKNPARVPLYFAPSLRFDYLRRWGLFFTLTVDMFCYLDHILFST